MTRRGEQTLVAVHVRRDAFRDLQYLLVPENVEVFSCVSRNHGSVTEAASASVVSRVTEELQFAAEQFI